MLWIALGSYIDRWGITAVRTYIIGFARWCKHFADVERVFMPNDPIAADISKSCLVQRTVAECTIDGFEKNASIWGLVAWFAASCWLLLRKADKAKNCAGNGWRSWVVSILKFLTWDWPGEIMWCSNLARYGWACLEVSFEGSVIC